MEDVFAQALAVEAGREGDTMLAPQEVQKMLALKALGWGSKSISRELGCSRNTVRQYLRQGSWRPMDVGKRAGALEPHQEWLAERLRRHRGNADVVRQDLERELGMAVSLRTVQRAVKPLRRELRAEALARHPVRDRAGPSTADRLRQHGGDGRRRAHTGSLVRRHLGLQPSLLRRSAAARAAIRVAARSGGRVPSLRRTAPRAAHRQRPGAGGRPRCPNPGSEVQRPLPRVLPLLGRGAAGMRSVPGPNQGQG